MCQTLFPWDSSHPSSPCTGPLSMWKSLQTRASRLRREREGSRVNSDFSWPGSGRVCTQHLLSPRATMARLKFLDFLYLKVSHRLLWKWIDLSCLYLEEDIVNNTFRRLLLPRLLGKHKNFSTSANNFQKEVLSGQIVEFSKAHWLKIILSQVGPDRLLPATDLRAWQAEARYDFAFGKTPWSTSFEAFLFWLVLLIRLQSAWETMQTTWRPYPLFLSPQCSRIRLNCQKCIIVEIYKRIFSRQMTLILFDNACRWSIKHWICNLVSKEMNLKGGEGSVKIFPHDYLLDSKSVFLQGLREGVKKTFFLGLCLKLWASGGPKSQTF